MNTNNYPNIPAEKFRFVADGERLHDHKLDTRKVSYFRDAFNRFCKNKSSVAAAIIIFCLVLYAILVPMFCSNNYTESPTDTIYLQYTTLLPRNQLCVDMGWNFWDGASDKTISEANYNAFNAMTTETGYEVFREVYSQYTDSEEKIKYDVRLDSYTSLGYMYLTVGPDEYEAIQQWQTENQVQVIFPAVKDVKELDASRWYATNKKGVAKLDKEGNYVNNYRDNGRDGDYDSLRIPGDPGLEDPEASDRYRYAWATGTSDAINYKIRVYKYTYFQYRYGLEPCFLFGTTDKGHDILTRLAGAARFSLCFAVLIASVNLVLGAIIGAIEGYYGGAVDMAIERIIDILSRVPGMIVQTLFQLHLAQKLNNVFPGMGAVVAMFMAFIMTGWIGTAGTTRMQFYRYKGQEYVLAARVLGASDWRIMFRHIFPNSLGTLITSSVLVIPGVIFSESSLTYLGIVNLDSSTMTSVGTMLANARGSLSTYPHIILFPALFISLLMITFNLFGNGLRDAFNPALRGVED